MAKTTPEKHNMSAAKMKAAARSLMTGSPTLINEILGLAMPQFPITTITQEYGSPRVTMMVDMSNPATQKVLHKLAYSRNRTISAVNTEILKIENQKGRLMPTNVVALANAANGATSVINAHHTLFEYMRATQDGETPNEHVFSLVIWVEPSDWESRFYETLPFIEAMYTRYDAGKPKSIMDQLRALNADINLGITVSQLTTINSIATSVSYDGSRGAPDVDTAVTVAMAESKYTTICTLIDHFLVQQSFIKLIPKKDETVHSPEQYSRIKSRFLLNTDVISAFIRARIGLQEAGDVAAIAKIDAFMESLYSDISPMLDSTAGALQAVLTRPDLTYLYSVDKPTRIVHAMMLLAFEFVLTDNVLTIGHLKTLINRSVTGIVLAKASQPLQLEFGTLKFTCATYRDTGNKYPIMSKIGKPMSKTMAALMKNPSGRAKKSVVALVN